MLDYETMDIQPGTEKAKLKCSCSLVTSLKRRYESGVEVDSNTAMLCRLMPPPSFSPTYCYASMPLHLGLRKLGFGLTGGPQEAFSHVTGMSKPVSLT